jgi:hypothetical protein
MTAQGGERTARATNKKPGEVLRAFGWIALGFGLLVIFMNLSQGTIAAGGPIILFVGAVLLIVGYIKGNQRP